MGARTLMDIQEWFRRYTVRLIELCPPNNSGELTLILWEKWGCIDRIGLLLTCYPESPEHAAAAIYFKARTTMIDEDGSTTTAEIELGHVSTT